MFEYSLKKRLEAFLLAIIFLFFLLITRLTFLQILNSNNLQALAIGQWTRGLSISSKRGTIYDRNGIVLAESQTSYNVYVRPASIKDVNKICVVLGDILDLDYNYIKDKCNNKKVSESLIKLQISQKDATRIYKANLDGVYLSENSKRYYPYDNLLCQVLGYTTIDNIGQSGLELYYDKYLKGKDGKTLTNTDIRGIEIDNNLDLYLSSIQGCDLYLTIDYYIQLMIENALTQIMENEKPKSATIIVSDPKTGEIIAMASSPSFNLNEIPRDNIEMLSNQSKCLSIVDVYEPGSTFKVLTTAMALQENLTTPEERFYDPGYRIVDGEKIKCWKLIGHGSQSMTDGLCNSCNSVFLDLALRLGKDKLYEYFEKFNFGSKLGVDFLGESGGIVMDYDLAQKVDYARMGFGQAIAVTPLQQINAICSVVNGGILYQPYFVKSITNSSGKEILTNSKSQIRRVIDDSVSETIKYMLEQVIVKASGINTFIPGYRVSGKTGTSQKY
ncbi:MAG: stage V sporulation protein D, partial [Clostridia bacterium]|nr:stage V sporulation protein D [Clostridia bacterium]